MEFDDSLFPAPVLTVYTSVPGKAVFRMGDEYLMKDASGPGSYSLSNGVAVTPDSVAQVQLVTGKLGITAPV